MLGVYAAPLPAGPIKVLESDASAPTLSIHGRLWYVLIWRHLRNRLYHMPTASAVEIRRSRKESALQHTSR